VKPGNVPELKPDEGLMVIVIDTTSSLRDVRFRKDGRLFDSATIAGVQPGATPRLYVVPSGTYEWSRVTTYFRLWYDFKGSPDAKFRVAPGVLNYPGDMLMRGAYTNAATFQFSNRSLQVMDWLEEVHPQVFAKYQFEYRGHYPDPFPSFYRSAQAQTGKPFSQLGYALEPPPAGKLPVSIRDLWRIDLIDNADMNPRGDMLIKVLNKADGTHFELVELPGGKTTSLMIGCCPIESMQWAGNDVFVVTSRESGATILHVDVFRFGLDAKGQRTFEQFGMSRAGVYAQALPEDPNHILFASRGEMNRLMVHRVSIRSRAAMQRFQPMHGTRINSGVKDDKFWLADGHGRLRLAIAQNGEDAVLMHGQGSAFAEILRYGLKQPFQPMLLSYEGDMIYGLSDDGREQRDLVAFDPYQKKIVSTLFSKPGVDIVAPIVDETRRPIGAIYYQGGHLVSEYFEENSQSTKALRELFPGETVAAYDRAENGDLLVWVESSRRPGALYHVDIAKKQTRMVELAKPWLKDIEFSDTELLSVPGPDGVPIEAYLTRPRAAGKRPLVVLSHGGPVGVRDERGFNPEVQFLASLGYAVLQVNFRGSDGYGTKFRESGRRAHGTLIEDDIDAVLHTVLADRGIDDTRVCAIGSSYGGYSAIVSTIRWPSRFKCAVSISGVTDWMLFFTASDGGNSARGREALEHYIGDPRTQAESLMRNSPIYRFREIKTPLLLIHGAEDTRVDYEHMRRLARMMNIAGVRPAAVTLEDEGHGFERLDNVEKAWSGIAGFLRRHLGDAKGASPTVPAITESSAAK
jgi:dienelactone hydrolase